MLALPLLPLVNKEEHSLFSFLGLANRQAFATMKLVVGLANIVFGKGSRHGLGADLVHMLTSSLSIEWTFYPLLGGAFFFPSSHYTHSFPLFSPHFRYFGGQCFWPTTHVSMYLYRCIYVSASRVYICIHLYITKCKSTSMSV